MIPREGGRGGGGGGGVGKSCKKREWGGDGGVERLPSCCSCRWNKEGLPKPKFGLGWAAG